MMSDSTGLEMVRMSRGNALSVAAAFIVCILVPASALLGVASWEALAARADDTVIDSLAFSMKRLRLSCLLSHRCRTILVWLQTAR